MFEHAWAYYVQSLATVQIGRNSRNGPIATTQLPVPVCSSLSFLSKGFLLFSSCMNPTGLLDHRQKASTNLPTTSDKAAMKLNNAMSIYLSLVIAVTVAAMDLDSKCKQPSQRNCSLRSDQAPSPLPAESEMLY